MECPEARMLLILLITFASTSLGNNGLTPRGRFGNFASSSYLSLFSLLYALTMFLTVDSGTPNFAAASQLPFTVVHLAISAPLTHCSHHNTCVSLFQLLYLPAESVR